MKLQLDGIPNLGLRLLHFRGMGQLRRPFLTRVQRCVIILSCPCLELIRLRDVSCNSCCVIRCCHQIKVDTEYTSSHQWSQPYTVRRFYFSPTPPTALLKWHNTAVNIGNIYSNYLCCKMIILRADFKDVKVAIHFISYRQRSLRHGHAHLARPPGTLVLQDSRTETASLEAPAKRVGDVKNRQGLIRQGLTLPTGDLR